LNGLDFCVPDAVATVNAWVSAKTKGKIPQIVSELSPLTVLVALNAVYFKSRWEQPFRKQFTRDHPFRTASQTIKQLPMMIQSGTYNYYEDPHVQVAALPYCGNVSMYIVLPEAKADLAQFREDLTSGLWESWLSKSTSTLGTIRLPRFKVDYQAELNSPLKALGMERAFDPDRAQFEHIHTDRPPVWVDRVAHRAVAEVNEEGTEAAAATMTTMLFRSPPRQTPPKRFQMIVDHPFFALIRAERTGTILFMGWICDSQ
jgi:serine protease inhibitor